MKLRDLPAATLEKIKARRWDRIIEKHEGPERWESTLRYSDPEFIQIDGRWVLLPLEREHHPNLTVLRTIVADDDEALTVFLKDTTFVENPAEEWFGAGFVAVCERLPGEQFYLAALYHEWFIIEQ